MFHYLLLIGVWGYFISLLFVLLYTSRGLVHAEHGLTPFCACPRSGVSAELTPFGTPRDRVPRLCFVSF